MGLPAKSQVPPANPWRYANGYYETATGLTKFGTRHYDSALARWTQQDPIAGTVASPATLNRFACVGGDPVNRSDPSGYVFGYSWDEFTEDVGGALECAGLTALALASPVPDAGSAVTGGGLALAEMGYTTFGMTAPMTVVDDVC